MDGGGSYSGTCRAEEHVPNQAGAEEIVIAVSLVMKLKHALEPAEEAGEARRSVEQNVEAVIEHHAAIHSDAKRKAVFPAAEPAESGHEKQADGSDSDQREADEELPGVFLVLPVEGAMLVVDAVMFTLAMGVCRLLSEAHFDVPPAVAQVMGKRPHGPAAQGI